jgi:hypothetical protein
MVEKQPDPSPRIPGALPLGAARLDRPATIRYAGFDDFLHPLARDRWRAFVDQKPPHPALQMVPIEAVQPGDIQVLAAREPQKFGSPRISLDGLGEVPSVYSVVTATTVEGTRELPQIKEMLLFHNTLVPDASTLGCLPSLESLHTMGAAGNVKLAFDRLRAGQLRRLAVPRWVMASLDPLAQLNALECLDVSTYPRDSVEPISELENLTYLRIEGAARTSGWASLRRCVNVEEAKLMGIRLSNLRRLSTWTRLRHLALSGSALKSLDGIEAFEHLETLHLIMLGTEDLAPLRGLRDLTSLWLTCMDHCRSLRALAGLRALRSLIVYQIAASARQVCLIDTLKPLAGLGDLEEFVLVGTRIEDSDLSPLFDLPNLKRVQLGSHVRANVEELRRARPDLKIIYFPPKPGPLAVRVGAIAIHPPQGAVKDWWIYEDLASDLGARTNHEAEQRIRRAVRKIHPDLMTRLSFDTEAGGVGISATKEEDIRSVATILNEMTGSDRRS